MWKRGPRQLDIQRTLAMVVIACLSVAVASSGVIASPGLSGASKDSRPRNAAAPLKAGHRVIRQPRAGASSDQQILIRLENGQRTLEQQTAVLNAALQRQISQLHEAVEDSGKETQQLLQQNAKTNTTKGLLLMVLALLLLIASGVAYIVWQLPSLTGQGLARKGKAPELNGRFAEFSDDTELRSDEEGIVSLRVRPRNS